MHLQIGITTIGCISMTNPEQPTVRERVKAIAHEMLSGGVTPDQMREFRSELSGLMWTANDARTAREIAFKKRLAEMRATTKSAVDARLQAENGPEYADWQEAVNVCEAVLEMMRTCRDNLKSLDTEMGLSR